MQTQLHGQADQWKQKQAEDQQTDKQYSLGGRTM